MNPFVRIGSSLALCWLAAMTPLFADRDAVLGTIDAGVFTGGRAPTAPGDGVIKETEQVIQADPANPHPLDSKIYHLRATCYGKTLIPLGKFGPGSFQLNWSTIGLSDGGSISVAGRAGNAVFGGPFVINQLDSGFSRTGALRLIRSNPSAYLYFQYDHPSPGTEHTVSITIMTTQQIEEDYNTAGATTATLASVYSAIDLGQKRFDFNRDAVFNGSVTIPGGNLVLGSEPAVTPSYLTTNRYLQKSVGAGVDSTIAFGPGAVSAEIASIAIGHNSQALATHSIALGSSAYAPGMYSTAIGTGSQAAGTYNSLAMMGAATGVGEYGREAAAIGAFAYAGAPASIALGYSARATGEASTAIGRGAESIGGFSTAVGHQTRATSYSSMAIGSRNIGIGSGGWSDLNPVLEVGNAHPWGTERSNAITTMANGRTVFTNRYWVSSTPAVVPTDAHTSGADALSVEGHAEMKGNARVAGTTTLNGATTVNGDAVLNGKVTLTEAQGDISMGIYQ